MAKKTKPSGMFSAELPCDGDNKTIESVVVANSSDKSDEIKALQNRNIELEKKCSYLEEKLSEYITEIDSLNTKRAQPKNSESKAEINKLTNQLEILQNSNDEYLMKISELTFENANLKSQFEEMQEMIKHKMQNLQTTNNGGKVNTCGRRLRPVKSNGYSDWN